MSSLPNSESSYLVKPLPVYFLSGLILVNFIAIFQFDLFHIGAFFAFFYIIITPGFLALSFLTQKKLTPMLGIVFSITLSILALMLVGLGVNTVLPFFGMSQPLTTIPLLVAFDILIYLLLTFNFIYRKSSPFEFHSFNARSWTITGLSLLLPLLSCLGALSLNNGGSNFFAMFALGLAFLLLPIVIINRQKINPSIPPITLYMMALSFLLANAMRGWFITGHDILLEYHVFTLVNAAHYWSMSLYQDPYMACLSLTILPTYLQNLLHVSNTYIFKFFLQFLGALPVVMIYYLAKEYSSEAIAFLAGFLYISFPSFMVDMAFLNRQSLAFIFFGALLFALLTTEYFNQRIRTLLLLLFGLGMVLSHYSTSYVGIALLAGAYIINIILRFFMTATWPKWFSMMTDKFGNIETYKKPLLITLPFIIGLFAIMVLWSVVITKTSANLFSTIEQIAINVEHPFSLDEFSGPAKYSLVEAQQETPQQLFNQFVQQAIQQVQTSPNSSIYFPLSLTESYTMNLVSEPLVPITAFGEALQSISQLNLVNFFNDIKQWYAKILQILLLIGLLGFFIGYSFQKKITREIPREYIALSISGIAILAGQTILPSSAVDYGLLRLFQQNLIFLALPITLGLFAISKLITRNYKIQLFICTTVLLFFFAILSGFFTQFTGAARAPLPLDNYGFYYDAYYTHAQELSAFDWMDEYTNSSIPVQADHYFSNIKMIAYANISPVVGLLPETIQKDSYVYFNYNNAQTNNIIEYVGGDLVYYTFPINFLQNNKNLVYNDGGSKIYK